MSKFKINYASFKKITAGKSYLAIDGLNTSNNENIALACFPKFSIAFNPENSLQVKCIIRGNPPFDGFIDLDESSVKKYTWQDICKWMPDVITPKMYIPKYNI